MNQSNRVISYSLFGYGKTTPSNCFEFNSYLRGLSINIRLAKLLYPNWKILLHVDNETNTAFSNLFEEMDILVGLTTPKINSFIPCGMSSQTTDKIGEYTVAIPT
jgi:hypothetical protein